MFLSFILSTNTITQFCILNIISLANTLMAAAEPSRLTTIQNKRNNIYQKGNNNSTIQLTNKKTDSLSFFRENTFEPISCEMEIDCEEITNTVCVDSECRCAINYKQSPYTKMKMSCQPFKCEQDFDCQEWDTNLVCSSKLQSCVCRSDYYGSHVDKRCHQMTGSMNWLLPIAIVPIVILVFIFVIYCTRLARTSVRLKETAASVKRRLSTFSLKSGPKNNLNPV